MAELDLEQKDTLSQIATRMCAWTEVILLAGYNECDRESVAELVTWGLEQDAAALQEMSDSGKDSR